LPKAIALADGPELLPLLHQKLGDCCGEPGDEPARIEAYVAALNQALAHYGYDSRQLTRYRNDLALLFIKYGQPEAAAQHLPEALHRAERAPANTPDYLTETARAHLLAAGIAYGVGRPEEGKAAVDRALFLTGRLDGRWLKQAHLLHRAARLLFEYDHPAAARPLIKQAWTICQIHPADKDAARIPKLVEKLSHNAKKA
jgi:tetratricopeptide (TPR) repeat protein